MDIKGNFTQANFIPLLVLLVRITSKLFRCQKYLKTQFLAHLLACLIGRLCFYLVISLIGLIIGLAIAGAESIGKEVAVGFSKYFLLKKLISFFRC